MLIYPLKNHYRISSKFGWRKHPVTGDKQYHSGVDYACPEGSRVVAVCDGIVIRVWQDDLNGNAIRLTNEDNTLRAGYAHLSEVFVKVGDLVKAGDCIAYSGNTGRSSGPHLHLSIYTSLGWQAVNPEKHIA